MRIINVFDAALEGDFEEFKLRYQGNEVNEYTKLNLLQTVMCGGGRNLKERLEIIDFLLSQGIDVNYIDKKDKGNALHYLYSNRSNEDAQYLFIVSKKLIEKGIDVNAKNKYGAIPLSYLIAGKLDTEEIKPLFQYLIDAGADYHSKDNYGNCCLDYAKQFSWRQGFVDMVEER